jgi:RNA polymerase sigma-70 factor, ECF subfamily
MDGQVVAPSAAVPHADVLRSAYPGLRALMVRATHNPALAEDLLNDAIVTALEKLQSGQIAEPSLLAGYVYRVALNHLRNHRRKQRGTFSASDELGELPDTGAAETNVAQLQQHQWASIVQEVLEELPTLRDRELIVRFYLRDEDKPALCKALGLSDAHFNRVVFRARERFRELLERRGLSATDLLSVLLGSMFLVGVLRA